MRDLLSSEAKLADTISGIHAAPDDPQGAYQTRLDRLTKPRGSLGRLEELARRYASIRGSDALPLHHKVVFVMAGDHGVVAEGVSAFPQAVTPQMVLNFLAGGAAINVLARHAGARVVVVDCGVASPIDAGPGLIDRKVALGTENMAKGPAMTHDQAVAAVTVGIEAFEDQIAQGVDIVGTGDMGIGNTTPSAAITSVLTGKPPAEVTGRGTGIDDDRHRHKVAVIERALAVNRPDPTDALDVLAKVGGFEIGALAGLCLAAARHRVPAVIDGIISTAGAALAVALQPNARDYLIAAHRSVEPGHAALLSWLGLRPLLDLDMRLGEGTGAALAIGLVEAGVGIYHQMASFESAGVDEEC